MIIDLHADTLKELYSQNRRDLLSNEDMHISIEKMVEGGMALLCFALFDEKELTKHKFENYLQAAESIQGILRENHEYISTVSSFEEIQKGIKAYRKLRKPMALLTVEDTSSMEGKMDNFEKIYTMGFRIFALSWNYDSPAGNGNFVGNLQYKDEKGNLYSQKGLKSFGFEMLEFINSNKGLIDVSHLSDRGFWDVKETLKKPFVATHSNARGLCDFPRNLTDEMLRAISQSGGVAGLNFCSAFLDGSDFAKLDDMVSHILYMIKKGGEDLPALGSDFDGISSTLEMKDASGYPLLIERMEKRGMSQTQIEKVTWKNAYRVFSETL